MEATISDLITLMDETAPARLAEKWDNPGLQVGDRKWPVRKVMVSLDPLPEVVAAACKADIDLLITHHPLIFNPLRTIDFSTPTGRILEQAFRHRLAVFSAHTNLDSVKGGVNDVLAGRLGLKELTVLDSPQKTSLFKLVFFAPKALEAEMLAALFETPAGRIGNYASCSFRTPGTGTFCPEAPARPYSGKIGEVSHEEEVRIEAVLRSHEIHSVVAHLKAGHPHETMAYDLYPLHDAEADQGIGRIGLVPETTELADLAKRIQAELGLGTVKIAGDPRLKITKAALCAGSGSGLMGRFMQSGAQVYISGDLRYHDARDAEAAGLGLIDIGHFASEHLMVDALTRELTRRIREKNLAVEVSACDMEKDPFGYL